MVQCRGRSSWVVWFASRGYERKRDDTRDVVMQVLFSAFSNTRTRMQRVRDAKFFHGWMKDLTNVTARASLKGNPSVELGDTFLVEVNGKEKTAVFQGQVSGVSGEDIVLTVLGEMNYKGATESARVVVEGVSGVMSFDGLTVDIDVIDVSAHGMGVVAAQTMRKGERIQISIMTPGGQINCSGEVRYSKPDTDSFGKFRIGIALDEFDRLASARWKRLHDSVF